MVTEISTDGDAGATAPVVTERKFRLYLKCDILAHAR